MTKLFLTPLFDPRKPVVALVSILRGEAPAVGSTLFLTKAGQATVVTSAQLVSSPTEADYLLIPQAVTALTPAVNRYLDEIRELAKVANKKIIVFIGGDLSHNIFIDDMIVLKGSQYGRLKRANEIIVPPLVEDLVEAKPRPKANQLVVGFCGWAAPGGGIGWLKYWLKNLKSGSVVFRKGLYFRRRAIKALKQSNLVKTNFLIRRSFSGNLKTASGDPAKLRREYIENIINSDFILAPKGDGNFSLRFYETLSTGRIPVLIDTDCALPLEGVINYDEVIVRVPYQKIGQVAELINNWYQQLSPAEWAEKQKSARRLFTERLRYDQFFNLLLARPLEDWLQARSSVGV
ncbi:MAG: hypothetical protein A2114_02735 [Candidatus Vogelbacteria bacterium GWA1_51_14]|uniref:Exostosin GT47 domain-containing protein n=1 Tax=Candidatus Vogelbacteria bacterium GWA1_51_14 TaxID=1802435 RepID=A0A1G2Q9L0_9BACT|nr:MAG: hypothetical protein A2114_02735 [Candidatus Vogelbacteria bacterium GWA1_51_14]